MQSSASRELDASQPLLSPRNADEQSAAKPTLREFVRDAWRSGMVAIFPMLLLWIAGACLVLPFVPNLMTDFFASNAAGHAVHCGSTHTPHGHSFKFCTDAANTRVVWASFSSFVSNVCFIFFMSPLVGVWSDCSGRKTFLVIGQLLSLGPYCVLLLHRLTGLSLYLYYPMSAVNGIVSPLVVALAFVADVLPPQHRAIGFGYVYGVFAVAFAFVPALGSVIGLQAALVACVAMKVVGVAYTLVCIRESVTPEAQEAAKRRIARNAPPNLPDVNEARSALEHPANIADITSTRCNGGAPPTGARYRGSQCSAGKGGFWRALKSAAMDVWAIRYTVSGLSILARNSEFMKLAATLVVTSLLSSGLYDVNSQFLIEKFGFQPRDFATLSVAFGVGGFCVQALLMQPLLWLTGEKGTLVVSQAASLVKWAGSAAAQTKFQVIGFETCGAFAFLALPTISAIKANAVRAHEQGAVQGAISGMQALASGIGPLIFMQLFRLFTKVVYVLRMVPASAAVLSLAPLIMTISLNIPRLQQWKDLNQDPDEILLDVAAPESATIPVPPDSPGGTSSHSTWTAAHSSSNVHATDGGWLGGHDVMAEEAGYAHPESDWGAGLLAEGAILAAAHQREVHNASPANAVPGQSQGHASSHNLSGMHSSAGVHGHGAGR